MQVDETKSWVVGLTAHLPAVCWYQFDSLRVPTGADTAWHQRTLATWVELARAEQTSEQAVGLCGQVVYGEVLASRAASLLHGGAQY